MAKAVWGIDISKFSIKAVRLEDQGGNLFVTGVDVLNIPASPDPEKADENLREGLLELKKRNGIGRQIAVCSMPTSTFNRIIRLPPVEPDKLAEIVNYEAQSQIPFPLDEVIWDFQAVDREYGTGEEREVMLFAVKREIVEHFLTVVEPVGLNIDMVQFAPIALYNFLAYDQDVKEGAMAIDFGADNTDLVLMDGSKFWIRNIPITGNQITKSIQNAFKLNFAEAEKLKRKASGAQTEKAGKILEAIQPVYGELTSEMHRSLGYFKSMSKGAKFAKVILLGNASKTLNLSRYIQQSLQMPANRIQKLETIQFAKGDEALYNANLGSLGTALGLALQGLHRGRNNINLLPVPFVRKKQIAKKAPVVATAAALLLATAVIGYVINGGRLEKLTSKSGDVEAALTNYNNQIAELDRVKNIKEQEDKLAILKEMYCERDLSLRVIDAVNANLPDNGPANKQDGDKMWILRWDLREEVAGDLEKTPVEVSATGATPPNRYYMPPAKNRVLKLELEVALDKNGAQTLEGGSRMLQARLLNIKYDASIQSGKIVKYEDTRGCLLQIKGLKAVDPQKRDTWAAEDAFRTSFSINDKKARRILLPEEVLNDRFGGNADKDFEHWPNEYFVFVVSIHYIPEYLIPPPTPPAGGTPPAKAGG